MNHVYVSDGRWAFDHDGWTREDELLAVTRAARADATPGAVVERLALLKDLEQFCAECNYRLPSQFAYDAVPRARAYIARFPPHPPDTYRRSLE